MSRAQKLGQIFLSATLAAATSPLVAQDTPVVFQHGILSGPNTWLMIGDTIARYLRVLPVAKQTDWWKTEATQASQLFNALNADPNTSSSSQRIPFVAHSNGGLVSRRLSIDDPRVANLVTVASPHRGAHIGNTFRNGQVLNYMTYFGDRLNAPLVFYANNDPAWQNVPYLITAINGWNSLWNWLSTNLNAELCPIVGYCVTIEDGFAAVVPMVVDVSEGSNLINQLNDPGNLSREQNALANRIYFYTSITADNGLLHFLFPDDWTSLASMRENVTAAYWLAMDYYDEHNDPFLASRSYMWYDGATELQMLDASWYWLIGTLDNAHTGYQCDPSLNCGVQLVVYANDGFIDHRSAGFDANHARVIQGDLAHTEQTKADVVATAIKQALNIDIGISLRSPANDPPTPTALSATIAGPSQTPPAAWCVWSAQISGGRAPYTFTWNLGRSRGSWTEYTTPQSDFTMQVNVTDVDGRTASNILPVSVYSGAPSCSG